MSKNNRKELTLTPIDIRIVEKLGITYREMKSAINTYITGNYGTFLLLMCDKMNTFKIAHSSPKIQQYNERLSDQIHFQLRT